MSEEVSPGPIPVVYIIDDDQSSQEMVRAFLKHEAYRLELFSSATAFLSAYQHDLETPACIVTDVCMPLVDGMELQRRLNEQRIRVPVIFMSAIAGVSHAVDAMKAGACDFLSKPLEMTRLVDCVSAAIEKDKAIKQQEQTQRSLDKRLALLTAREKEVMALLVQARGTKEIAGKLGISAKTVFVHRARTLEKMGVDSLVELSHLMNGRNL